MNERNYNKLLLNKNRNEGSEKILLGYQHDAKEIVLKKDKETYFHVPYYTKPISLKDTNLVLDGATGAPYPAAADRIFKNQKEYGLTTANGTPTGISDGTWFCSWLYKDKRGNLKWMDRFYNPGTLKFKTAILQLSESPEYIPNNPIFRDVPSKMVFEPGVMYRYHHAGELTAQSLITSFGGLSSERLLLDLSQWRDDNPNQSLTTANLQPKFEANTSKFEITGETTETNRVEAFTLNFDNNRTINVSLNYSSLYNPANEFSLSFWAKSPDWQSSQSTQLVGNFSAEGGYGLFIETLSSYPLFVIPETTYGHALYINNDGVGFLDKSLKFFAKTSVGMPELVCVDSDNNVVFCNSDNTGTIYKLDNTGKLIGSSKKADSAFSFEEDEMPAEIICGYNNSIIVRTNKKFYTFDVNFNLLSTITDERPLSASAVSSFRYKKNSSFYELHTEDGVLDSKFIETTQWYITLEGNLYKKEEGSINGVPFFVFEDKATCFSIDPYERLWVMHGNNQLSIFDSTKPAFTDPIAKTNIGLNISHAQKNISFVCRYNRATNSREWLAIIYLSEEHSVYTLDINGNLIDTLNLKSLFDLRTIQQLSESVEEVSFLGKGDFTSYEHKRVFFSIAPYNNEPQLMLKTSLKDKTKKDLWYAQFVSQSSIKNWEKQSWRHLCVVLKNKTFIVYDNGEKQSETSYTGQFDLTYETQPPLFIGTPVGSQEGFNKEVGSTCLIFNGAFEDIKIYDYALTEANIDTFIKAAWKASDLYWLLPVPNIQYIEQIERMFKNKIPGSKSLFYNLNLRGTGIKDEQTKQIIEEQLKLLLRDIQPAHADFLKVHWVD